METFLRPSAGGVAALAVLVAARLALASPRTALALAWAFAAALLLQGFAFGRPLQGAALAGAALHGASFATARGRGWGLGGAFYEGQGVFLSVCLLAGGAADAWGLLGPGGLDGLLAKERADILAEFRSAVAAAYYGGAFPVEFSRPPDVALPEPLETVGRLAWIKALAAVYAAGVPLLAFALGAGRNAGSALATFRAGKAQMPFLVVALAWALLAPKVGGDRLAAHAAAPLWACGALLWVQGLAVHAWAAKRGRRTRQKGLYFLGLAGAIIAILWPMIGVLAGFCDVYLNLRARPRADARS